ncbi:MAG: glycosyltransferase family 4 protein [Oscillospiraceae bacterium]
MKIAMIGHKRIPSREGGVEIVVEQLAVRMVQQGHTVHAYNRLGKHVSTKKAGQGIRQKSYQGVCLLRIPTLNIRGLDALLYSVFATLRALFGGYDVIHYHSEGPCAMLWLPRLFGIKTVATIHGLDWQRAKWGGFAKNYLLFGEKTAAKHAGAVTVLSKNVQDYFKQTYGRDTVFLPNGVVKANNIPAKEIEKEYGLKKDGYILFLSRLVPEKGLLYLLQAYRNVDTEVRLVVAGGASHSAEYVEQVQKEAAKDPRVLMTGFVEGRMLEELFSNCKLYVLPSDIEGMPISLLEAMSYGCRCLTSDIAESVQVIEEYGETFAKGDVRSLQAKLTAMLNNASRYTPKEISDFVVKKYNWDSIVSEYIALYSTAKQNKKARGK